MQSLSCHFGLRVTLEETSWGHSNGARNELDQASHFLDVLSGTKVGDGPNNIPREGCGSSARNGGMNG